jgi:hypothetical protein
VGHKVPIETRAGTASFDPDTATGLLEGHVQIEVGGRIFTTERALMMQAMRAFKMDEVEVLQKVSSEAIPAR